MLASQWGRLAAAEHGDRPAEPFELMAIQVILHTRTLANRCSIVQVPSVSPR